MHGRHTNDRLIFFVCKYHIETIELFSYRVIQDADAEIHQKVSET